MHIPVIPHRLARSTSKPPSVEFPPEVPLSTEPGLELQSLYEYVGFCRRTLAEIERDLLHLEFGPDGLSQLHKIAKKLSAFGTEADSWGFQSLYQVAFSLQLLLRNAGGRIQSDKCWEALQQGLRMLSALVEQCEHDFQWRLAISETLNSINKVTHE